MRAGSRSRRSLTVGVQAVRETDAILEVHRVSRRAAGELRRGPALRSDRGEPLSSVSPRRTWEGPIRRLTAAIGSQGTFRIDLGYFQTPHRFSFFGATPYVENTPGVFTLNDVIRSAAQALVPTGTGTNIAAARALVSTFLTSAGPIDLGLREEKGDVRSLVDPQRALERQRLGEP